MNRLLLLGVSILLINCSSRQNEKSELRFNEFVTHLPLRTLPIDFSCGLPDGTESGNLQSSELKEFAEFIPSDQNLIFGIIGDQQDFTLVIYGESGDDIYPTLYSYDKLGKRIDSLSLTLKGCGGVDESSIPYSTAHIDKSLQIIPTDTVKFIHYPNGGTEYVLDSLEFSSVNYSVDKNGRIIKSH